MGVINTRRAEAMGRDKGGANPDDDHADVLESSRYSRGDIKLLRQAVRNGWPVTEDMKSKLVAKVDHKLDHVASVEDIDKLGRLIIGMDGANQKDTHLLVRASLEAQSASGGAGVDVYDEDELAAEHIIERRRAAASLPPSTIGLNGAAHHTTPSSENGVSS